MFQSHIGSSSHSTKEMFSRVIAPIREKVTRVSVRVTESGWQYNNSYKGLTILSLITCRNVDTYSKLIRKCVHPKTFFLQW